jgi:hypothetical protein
MIYKKCNFCLQIAFVAICFAVVAAMPQAPVETIKFVDEKTDDGYNFAWVKIKIWKLSG